jgi:hypothetical protein
MNTFARLSISLLTLAGLAGIAAAGDPAAKGAPAPTADKKAAPTPTPTPTDKAAPVAPAGMPKPGAEIAGAFKAMSGNWKCAGTSIGPDMKTEIPTKGTIKNKMDLDKWWIVTSMAETKKGGYKFTSYTSFDGKKWTRAMFDNMGGHDFTESTGMKDNKMVWDGTSVGMGMTMKSRHTEQVVSPKEIKLIGEYSMDGKQWMKGYDVTCKK